MVGATAACYAGRAVHEHGTDERGPAGGPDRGPLPLRSLEPAAAAAVRLVATDVDGTLTHGSGLDPQVVAAIAALVDAGVEVMPVSGRPSGEVLGLARYLPGVRRGIAENGMVEVVPDQPPRLLVPAVDRAALRELAQQVARAAGLALAVTADDPFRVVDVAFEREHRDDEVLAALARAAATQGLFVTWSSVHVHFTRQQPDKGAALLRAAGVPGEAIATIGDAPNDAGLFVAGRFGVTVGTADVLRQRAFMPAMPAYVTAAAESAGFLELARAILAARGRAPAA